VPTGSGANDGGILLTDNSLSPTASAAQSIPLSGTGKDVPKVSLSRLSLTFQPRLIQTASPTQTFTIKNSGTAVLQIAGIALSGANSSDFAMTTICGSTLAVNTTCSTTVTFTPQVAESRTATITFTDNAGGATGAQQNVKLTGTGLTRAASPTFNVPAGTYSAAQSVTIGSTTSGAMVYYTTDGTTPTTTSPLYSTPVAIGKNATLKAMAVATGYAYSLVSSSSYSIRTAAPTFNPKGGTTFATAQAVTISSITPNATIYYTLDGTTPTTGSTQYSAPVVINKTTTLKAIAAASGYATSPLTTWTYTIQASAPKYSPTGGTYGSAQSVKLSSITPGATIYYTTDGTWPTTSSTLYSVSVAISKNTTIKAIAVATGYAASPMSASTYSIQAATPVFSPKGGTYSTAQPVTLSSTTPGAKVYYTTDGSTPTTGSSLYSAPVVISKNTTLRAIAVATGYASSPAAIWTYTIRAAAPTFNPPAGTYATARSVTIGSTTGGASFYYTTDGTTPTTSSTLYSAPVVISKNTTLKAIAVATGYGQSTASSATYTIP
jgi:hypothetical protein